MNKEYIYTDGKVTIIDEKGNMKKEVCYDNIDKVLIEENVIETMENEIEKIKKEWINCENSKKDKSFWIVPLLGGSIISLISPLLVISMLTGKDIVSLVNDAFYINYILSLTGMVFPIGLMFGAIISTMGYIQYRKNIKMSDGVNSQMDFLINKSKANENVKARIVKVSDGEELKKLENELNQYYELGYNIDKYCRYYEQGKLQENLPDNVSFNLAQEYIKKKKLIRKK